MARPTLDLDRIIERPVVRIDGTDFELKDPGEFSVVDTGRLRRNTRRVVEMIQDYASLTDKSQAELEANIDELMDSIFVNMPEAVRRSLTFEQVGEILAYFTLNRTGSPVTADEAASPQTGDKSRASFHDGTEDAQANGSNGSR